METIQKLLQEEPADPRSVDPLIESDLAVICLKCLEKEPVHRYESAASLADDLQRFLEGRPIEARQTTQITRLIKWSRRRPAVASLSVFSIAALVAFVSLLLVSNHQIEERRLFAVQQTQLADDAATREEEEKTRLRNLLDRLDFDHAEALLQKGETAEAFAYLARLTRQSTEYPVFRRRLLNALLHETKVVPAFEPWPQPGGVGRISFSPDGNRLAMAGSHGWIQVRDTGSGAQISKFLAHEKIISAMQFNPDGSRILSSSTDGTATIWDAATGEPIAAIDAGSPIRDAVFSPDGSSFATASDDRSVCAWNAVNGELSEKFWHASLPLVVRFSHDASLLATGTKSGEVRLLKIGSPNPQALKLELGQAVGDIRFSPNGRLLAVASAAKAVRIWRTKNGAELPFSLPHNDIVNAIAFSSDGRFLASASNDHTSRIWRIATGSERVKPIEREMEFIGVQFSPDDATLLTTSWGRSAQLWDARTGVHASQELAHSDWVRMAAVDPSGRFLATASTDRTTQIWRRPANKAFKSLRLPDRAQRFSYNSSSQSIVAAGHFPGAVVWNATEPDGATLKFRSGLPVKSSAISGDGSLIACGNSNGEILIASGDGRTIEQFEIEDQGAVNSIAFARDSEFLAAGFQKGQIRVWRGDRPGDEIFRYDLGQPVARIQFSPSNDRLIALPGGAGRLAVISLGAEPAGLAAESPNSARLQSLMIHPDGDKFLTACSDRRARAFSTATGEPLPPEYRHDDSVFDAVYNASANRIATVSKDRSARIWDAESGELIGRPLLHESAVYRAAFSSDGSQLATGTEDGMARVWDIESGLPVLAVKLHERRIIRVEFMDNDSRLLTGSLEGTIKSIPVYPALDDCENWLPDLAEAIGGLRLDSNRLLNPVLRDQYPTALAKALESPAAMLFDSWRLPPANP